MSVLTPPNSNEPGSEPPSEPSTFSIGYIQPKRAYSSKLEAQIIQSGRELVTTPSPQIAAQLTKFFRESSQDAPLMLSQIVDTARDHIGEPEYLHLLLLITLKWPDLEYNNYSLVVQMLTQFEKSLGVLSNMVHICPLVAQVAQADFIGKQELLSLARSVLDCIILESTASSTKRYLIRLLLTLYQTRDDFRPGLLDLVLHYLRKPLQYIRDQPISKYSDMKINALAILVIEFIQITGCVELSAWDEAVTYSRRKSLVEQCQLALKAVDQVVNTVVKTCLDLSPSETVTEFLDDVLNAVSVPELCGSETLVRCYCITLLLTCKDFHNRYRFPPPHIFETLSRIQRTLYAIFKSPESKSLGTTIDYLISNDNIHAALYFATLECAQTNGAEYRDFHLRFTTPQTRVASIAAKRWLQVLKSRRIGKLYESTVDVLLILSESGVPGPAYVEILRSLAVVVYEYPDIFKRIEPHILSQLSTSSSVVSDLTVQIVSNYIAVTSATDQNLISRVMTRVPGPGNIAYKKRCIKLLDQVYVHSPDELKLQTMVCKYLLILANDSKSSIANLALRLLCQYIESSSVKNLCVIFQQILKCGRKFEAMIHHVLSQPMQKKAIHRLVSYLLQSLDDDTPDYEQLRIAALFIRANGLFLPPSKVPTLVQLSLGNIEHQERLVILKMLEAALTSKPKIILSPKVVAQLYKKMLDILVMFNEQELECAGHIMWELASLGRGEEQTQRKENLQKMYSNALEALNTTKNTKVLSQLISLIGVGARMWVFNPECIDVLIPFASAELRLQVIRTICRVCTQFPRLFLEGNCYEFFQSNVFIDKSGPEWAQFMAVFLEFLESQDSMRSDHKMTVGVLHGSDESLVAESTLDGLFQSYFEPLEKCALSSENATAVTATRLLCRGIITSKVDSSACTATITTLACSRNVEINQNALECFACLVERNQLSGIAKGLLAANHIPKGAFKAIWEIIDSSNTQAVISQLLDAFTESKDYAITIFNGLSQVILKVADARHLEKQLDKLIYSPHNSAQFEVLLIVFRAVIQYKYPEDTTPVIDLVDPQLIFDSDCESILAQVKKYGDFETILEIVRDNAGPDHQKRRRLV